MFGPGRPESRYGTHYSTRRDAPMTLPAPTNRLLSDLYIHKGFRRTSYGHPVLGAVIAGLTFAAIAVPAAYIAEQNSDHHKASVCMDNPLVSKYRFAVRGNDIDVYSDPRPETSVVGHLETGQEVEGVLYNTEPIDRDIILNRRITWAAVNMTGGSQSPAFVHRSDLSSQSQTPPETACNL